MRLPYAPSAPPDPSDSSTTETYNRIAARRAPRPLIPLDLALLHSPPVADGWNGFLGAIRSGTGVDKGLLELAVCRVAVLNGAVYEWNAHAPLALKGGVKPEGLRTARTTESMADSNNNDDDDDGGESVCEKEEGEGGLSHREWAVLAYTDQMTRNVSVDDGVFARLGQTGLSEREIVEITAAIAGYNCVSRVLVALDVGEWNGKEMKSVEELEKEVK